MFVLLQLLSLSLFLCGRNNVNLGEECDAGLAENREMGPG